MASLPSGLVLEGQSSYIPTDRQITISWSDITATLHDQTSSNERRLLKGVSGIAKPGQLLAILGGSGAGKTTFLNIISGRLWRTNADLAAKDSVITGGSIYLNGYQVGARIHMLKRVVAFVEQDDIFPGFLTVGEHLWFNAQLRMTSSTTTDEERRKRIDALMTELGLAQIKDTTIGFVEHGQKTLSGGERKRLAVATELLANAPLLYLDEPTTGLDSFTAESVISALQRLAQLGKTVIFTIHQPSSELFTFFDRLYLMCEGRVCFCGDPKSAANFFASPPISRPCPISYNPADFYLDVLSRPYLGRTQETEQGNEMEQHAGFINRAFVESHHGDRLLADLKEIADRASNIAGLENSSDFNFLMNPKAGFWKQLRWTTWRAALTFYRTPQWIQIRIGQVVSYSLFFGLCFWNLSLSPLDVSNRCGIVFVLVGSNTFENIDAYAISIPLERAFLERETQAGLYSLAAYFFGRQFVELPFILGACIFQVCVISLMSNFWLTTTPSGVVIMHVAIFLAGVAASSFGYVIGFISDNLAAVLAFRRIFIMMLSLCNGFYVNVASIQPFIRWFAYCSLFYYATETVFIEAWTDAGSLPCPTGENSTDSSECFPDGRAVLDYYSFGGPEKIVPNLLILLAMIVILRLFALFVLYYRSYGSTWLAIVRNKLRR